MKLLVAGSPSITDFNHLATAMDMSRLSDEATRIVIDYSKGVARLGERWGLERRLDIDGFSLKLYTNKFGKDSAARQQRDILAHADAAVVLWTKRSIPLWATIQAMRAQDKPVDLYELVDGHVQAVLV